MPTPSEEQDEEMKQQGFCIDKDYEYPKFAKEEHESLELLRDKSKDEKVIKKFFGSFEEFLGKLKRASSVHDIENVYKGHKIEARIFSEFTGNMPLPEKEMKLLNGMLFNKLDLILEYEDVVNFIARDGGEIREKIAYEADGKTQKEGWKRLYFK